MSASDQRGRPHAALCRDEVADDDQALVEAVGAEVEVAGAGDEAEVGRGRGRERARIVGIDQA